MQWICNLALFMVLSGILLEMIADTKYYKFARWVAGVILLLQFAEPFTEPERIWEKFTASFLSFDYGLGTDKVLEEIYCVDEAAESRVLAGYKENVSRQIGRLLEKNELVLIRAELAVADSGEILSMEILAEYQDGTEEGAGRIVIPTVVPVRLEEKGKKEKKSVSPMELYIREVLAEFYQLEENKIEVVIQEAE